VWGSSRPLLRVTTGESPVPGSRTGWDVVCHPNGRLNSVCMNPGDNCYYDVGWDHIPQGILRAAFPVVGMTSGWHPDYYGGHDNL